MQNFILRYAAAITGAISTFLQVLVAYGLHLSDGQVGVINAIVAAAFGLATAALVAQDRLLPAILAFAQAAFDLLIAFGLHLTDQQVSTALALLAAIATPLIAAFTHTQVHAAVNAHGQRVPKRGLFRLAA
ncbi:hypothetical protein NE236_42090 [Actinoallomurus purpureus]|uniref:hypothetical protein n=1 Tax=Actinoallomurus purpureus TaxID=478114 RepID=UPI0020932E04|nr:hypothetical protein [Actinoallomurus purpureus]MCO6011562.1 hypothetical protein [Actinoallomurus purpureus]